MLIVIILIQYLFIIFLWWPFCATSWIRPCKEWMFGSRIGIMNRFKKGCTAEKFWPHLMAKNAQCVIIYFCLSWWSNTIARALINPGSSALFVLEPLAQHCPRGFTALLTRFRMFPGVWHWGQQGESWVEAYLLRKKAKDLLHRIPVALIWEHLFDLQQADSDFRNQAHIDLLLRAEVLTSILRDSRQTRPWNTSYSINIGFGWVLFGTIEVSNVVVVPVTLEQDVNWELTGTRHCYEAVPTADKNKDLQYSQQSGG